MADLAWSTACADWQRRVIAREPLILFPPLFPAEAGAALEVFKSLQVVDLPRVEDAETGETRHPTFGEVSDDWVLDFVAAVFGAYDAESATRLIEEFFLLVSKKNGKSTLVAGIMLTALIRNWRHSAELLILAPTREVADNAYKPAADMVRADPTLMKLLAIRDDLKQITHRITRAVLKVVSADATSSAGKKAAFVLVEELWLFGKKAGAAAMLQEATGGLISRSEGFVIYISTQSDAPPTGVFKEKLDYFRNVRDGKIDDPRSLPVLYEFPPAMIDDKSYLDPDNFYVTNPNIGRSVRKDWLTRKLSLVRSGQDEEGDTIQTFLAKHLNVEIGMNLRANRWPGAAHWEGCADKRLTLQSLIEECEAIVVGIDGGGLDDLFGFAALGRLPTPIEVRVKIDDLFGLAASIEQEVANDGVYKIVKIKPWRLWSHAWCHRGVLDLRKSIATQLTGFENAGELTIVDDALADLSQIVATVERIKDTGLLAEVAVDPAGLGEFVDAMDDIGVTQDNGLLIGVSQGYRMMNAIKTFERRLANGTLMHNGSDMMAWCVGNVKIEPTATAIRATKQHAGDAKIDPWAAAANAVDRMALNPTAGVTLDIAAMVA